MAYGAGRSFNAPGKFRQFDLGKAVQTGQRIQYNRMQNQQMADEQQERQDMLRSRKKANEIRQMYDSMPDQIAALETEGMFDQADQLRDSYIGTRKNEVTMLENVREFLDKDNYKQFRQDMITAGAINPDMMPVEYSDDWLRKQADDKKRTLQNFTQQSFENGALMSRDYVTENGDVRWDLTGEWYDTQKAADAKKGKGGSGPGGKDWMMKAADTNAIGKQAERIFGGFYDPQTGRLKGLDKTEAARVQAVVEEAERIYNENRGVVSHGVAVARAARKLRINIEDYRDTAATNPLNLNLQ